MRIQCIQLALIFIVVLTVSTQSGTNNNNKKFNKLRVKINCQPPSNGQHVCYCGKTKTPFDRQRGQKCIDGIVISKGEVLRYEMSTRMNCCFQLSFQ